MLKLTVKPGEYLMIGDEIKLIFAGGSSNNLRILVDAPKSVNIARSAALEQSASSSEKKYRKDPDISDEARERINAILREERRKSRQ